MRHIAIWFLHYYSDNRQPIPTWLQRWIDRDPILSDYAEHLHQLERKLSVLAGAPVRTVLPTSPLPYSSRPVAGMQRLGWGAALAASVMIIVTSMVVWNGVRNDEPGVAPVQPKVAQATVPSQEAPWQEGAKKAKAWALRSLQANRETSARMASSLDNQLDREILALRKQMKDATRFVAVELPKASLKLLGIPR
ncbi:MAG: hypothetical protein MUF23_12855 [Pirellula sp.]|jgi:hypothetical protein|nr:hypothetical protein [Pirellula sp.]